MKKHIKIFSLILIISTCFVINPVFSNSNLAQTNAEIKVLNNELKDKKKEIEEIKKQQEEYSKLIKKQQESKVTLKSQLSILENRILKSGLDIKETEIAIEQINLEVRKLNLDIAATDKKIESGKKHLANLLKLVYKQDQVSTLEALLLNSSLADFLNQAKYLEDTNEEIANSLDGLKRDKKNLEHNQELKLEISKELLAKKNDLKKKKDALEYEKNNKENILAQTASKEKEFQSFLSKAKAEQTSATNEILSLERTVREKISLLENSEINKLKLDSDFAWPVTKNYITATFHDPTYPFRKIIGEHSGIDIRAAQGSALRTTAFGYVAKVKYDGSGRYAYIMIIHGDGFSSVYGHISKVSVKEDEYVLQGQVIGATGGMPGTPGSGYFSTGPHLHFEIRKDGIPVNPLNYLP
jgi:murein DD-endopeptidase MepM/ murein hydrolase activator NlpD